ncbi:MAG: SMI1/KNR4 family protein [Kofleriaceae bacterium]
MAIAEIWQRIAAKIRTSAPAFTLPAGASEADIVECETALGVSLPADYRESVAIHDGTKRFLFAHCELKPLTSVVSLWHLFEEVLQEPLAVPLSEWMRITGPIRLQRWSSRWIPIARTTSADTFLLDLDPAPGGNPGQVIHMTHETSVLRLIAPSFEAWVGAFADALDADHYEARVYRGDLMELEERQ